VKRITLALLSTLQALGRTKHYELAPGLSRPLQKWRILNHQIHLKKQPQNHAAATSPR
jgi:hypothetical protein